MKIKIIIGLFFIMLNMSTIADEAKYYRFVLCPWDVEKIEIGKTVHFPMDIRITELNKNNYVYNVFWQNSKKLTAKISFGIIKEITLNHEKAEVSKVEAKHDLKYEKMSEKYYDICLKNLMIWQYLPLENKNNSLQLTITRKAQDVYIAESNKSLYKWELRIHNEKIQQAILYKGEESLFFAEFYPREKNHALYSFQLQKKFMALFYPHGNLKGLVMLNDKNESIKIGYEWSETGKIINKRDFDKNPFRKNEIRIIK